MPKAKRMLSQYGRCKCGVYGTDPVSKLCGYCRAKRAARKIDPAKPPPRTEYVKPVYRILIEDAG